MKQSLAEQHGFGKDFWPASLATMSMPDRYLQVINQWLKNPKYIFLFSGTTGIGKTHLCAAITNELWGNNVSFRFFTQEKLFSQIKQGFSQGYDQSTSLQSVCDNEFLIIDDLTEVPSEWEQKVMFEIVQTRADSHKPTILTTNASRETLAAKYGIRCADRLFNKRNLVIVSNEQSKRTT